MRPVGRVAEFGLYVTEYAMKLRRDSLAMLMAILCVWLIGIARAGFAAETIANTNAPTGFYVSLSDEPELFIIDLMTNGVYTVQATGVSTSSQSGVWRWSAEKREFLLTPGTNGNAFSYELRVLRIDPQQVDTLQWVPLQALAATSGATDYVRFKRVDPGVGKSQFPHVDGNFTKGEFIDLNTNATERLYIRYGPISDSGVELERTTNNVVVWRAYVRPLYVTHSGYIHNVSIRIENNRILVSSSGEQHIFEVRALKDGAFISRKVVDAKR